MTIAPSGSAVDQMFSGRPDSCRAETARCETTEPPALGRTGHSAPRKVQEKCHELVAIGLQAVADPPDALAASTTSPHGAAVRRACEMPGRNPGKPDPSRPDPRKSRRLVQCLSPCRVRPPVVSGAQFPTIRSRRECQRGGATTGTMTSLG
jgi:hypothetical protein